MTLPLSIQFLIASVAYAINERMAKQIDYLLEEIRVLHEGYTEATGRKRVPFTDDQRRRLALKGKSLTPQERERCCQLVRPSTILEWFRRLADTKPAVVPEPLSRHFSCSGRCLANGSVFGSLDRGLLGITRARTEVGQ